MNLCSPGARLLRIAISAAIFLFTQTRSEGTERFLVRSWQSEDGLPSNIIRAVAQAADGYLWVATAEGVVRFDGVHFSRFGKESQSLLSKRSPRALFALPSGDVWISTARGGLLRWGGQRIVMVWEDAVAGQPANLIRQVTQVASDGGAGVFIERGEEAFHVIGTGAPRMLEKTPELGEKLHAAVSAQWQHGATAPTDAPLEFLDSHSRLWMRTQAGGLVVSEAAGESEAVVLPELSSGSRITALHEDRENGLWVATSGSGLFRVQPHRVRVFGLVDGLSDRSVLAVLEDRSGALWAGSKGGGIDRIVNGKVTHFQVGVDGGVRRFVSTLCEDRAGTLWAATRNGTVYRWQDGGFRTASSSSMPVWRAVAMVADADGRVWFGDEHGLAAWADGILTRYGAGEGIPAQDIVALALDGSGGLWAGTSRGVLYYGRDGRFAKAAELKSRSVSALLPNAGGVWVTTLGSGLFFCKDGRITRFSEQEGLPDDRLTCVLDDGAGFLWLGSLAGIFRVGKGELEGIVAQRKVTVQWLQFDRADGMLSRECTGDFQPAGWRGRDGTLFFPTVNGIAKVQPATIELNTLRPPVVIEDARASGHPWQRGGDVLRAGPGQSRLEFRYTALSFNTPEKMRFRTKLQGLDREWRDAGTQRTVAYEAVPPGRYSFRVRAANSDGLWSESGATLAVLVAPHFWETLSFKIAAVAFAAVFAFGIGVAISRARWRGRMLRLEAQNSREKERARIAQDLHDDLGASLTEISILSHLAADEHSGHNGRDPLPEIASKARGLVSALDEIVWAVNPRHDTLASLAEYLTAFAAEFLDTAGIALRLDIPNALPALSLSTEQRHGLFLAVREALNNVVKHSGASEVRLRFSFDDDELKVAVEDNGHGLSVEASELSEGLRNMRERMERTGGTCRIESAADGTNVCFSLSLVTK